MNLSDFTKHLDSKLDKFYIQCQFTYDDLFQVGLYSGNTKGNTNRIDIKMSDMPDKFKDLISDTLIYMWPKEKKICEVLRPVINIYGDIVLKDSRGSGVEFTVLVISLADMPEEYQALYAKFKLLEQ